jgi:isopenicillin-N epimerase
VIYLNTGSYGLVSRPVFERAEHLRRTLHLDPVDFLWRKAGTLLTQARSRLADWLGTSPDQLIFLDNVTTAMNVVAASLRLAAPGEILLTDHEYPAIRFAWERAAQAQGLRLRYARLPPRPKSSEELAEAVLRQATPATRLLFFSHVLYTTGLVMPVERLCREARRRGLLTVVDGAHAPGMLDLHLDRLGCDFYGANLHKWFLAPVGAGFLYVRPGLEDRILPLTVSWGWYYERDRAREQDGYGGNRWQRSFEFSGSRDITPWLVVPEAIAFFQEVGWADLRARQRSLAGLTRRLLDGLCGLQPATPVEEELCGAITAWRLPRGDPQALRAALWERYRIEINMIEHPAGPWLRVSTNFYNTPAELEALAAALRELLA